MQSEQYNVLVVTKDKQICNTISLLLRPPTFDVMTTSDFNEARRILSERTFAIIIVDSGDGFDIDFALDAANQPSAILLLAPVQNFDQISFQVESYGILTITKPFDAFYFYNMIKIAIAVHYKIQLLSSQTIKLEKKMEEIRVINRAKMLLMQNKSFSEEEAHRYLEKEAMDKGLKKITLAQEIISLYS